MWYDPTRPDFLLLHGLIISRYFFFSFRFIIFFFLFSRKEITLEIIEEDSYEKDALFYVELGEPQLQGGE